jgi:hypothetical protein
MSANSSRYSPASHASGLRHLSRRDRANTRICTNTE